MKNFKSICLVILGIIIFSFVITVTSNLNEDNVVIDKTEVEAVYFHLNNQYTVVKLVDDKYIFEKLGVCHNNKTICAPINVFYKNVEKSYYECDYYIGGLKTGHERGSCSLYISSIDKIKTGDWNRGKFGSGTTTRIDK